MEIGVFTIVGAALGNIPTQEAQIRLGWNSVLGCYWVSSFFGGKRDITIGCWAFYKVARRNKTLFAGFAFDNHAVILSHQQINAFANEMHHFV